MKFAFTSLHVKPASGTSPGWCWEEPMCQMSRGNTSCSKGFLKQLIKSGTGICIESIIGLFNEKSWSLLWNSLLFVLFVLLITGIVLYQQCVQSEGFSVPTKAHFIHVFLNLLSNAEHLEIPLMQLYSTASYHSWHSCQIKFGYLGHLRVFNRCSYGFCWHKTC